MKAVVLMMFMAAVSLVACSAVMAQDLSDIERDAKALELFLQDKKDHEKNCPRLKWDQPKISVYKSKLKSQLPEGCKR